MDTPTREKVKKGLITKTWERCKSLGRATKTGPASPCARALTVKSKSWHGALGHMAPPSSPKPRVAPEGCFSVYVGPQKQRFVIKTKYANHPLFVALLEEAESEYGHNSCGPIELPCNVDVLYRVLIEMDSDDNIRSGGRRGCGFAKGYGSAYRLLSPSRMTAVNQF